jgi:membrane protein implicated in regulation of membrane protease activity
MVEWISIISLIAVGLALVIAEIVFVPGTTLVGIVGFVLMAIGVGLGFKYFGGTTGWTIAGVVLVYAFKSNVWGRFSLKSTMEGRVNEGALNDIIAGTEGTALSALRPSGKAEILQRTVEVRTLGAYVESGTKVRVTQVMANQVIVEPIS